MAANPSIQLGTDGNWAIKEDNLLAYKKDGTRFFNKEFDFTRGSLATFVDKDGLIKVSGVTDTELVTNGDFATSLSGWSNSNNHWQWTSQGAYFPLISTHNPLTQILTNPVGVKLKITFTLNIVQGTVNFYYKNTSNSSVAAQYTQSGTYTLITQPVKQNTDINFSRYGGINTEFYLNNVSAFEIQLDVPRIDFTDDATGHLLLEPQSTNLIPYSEDFSQSSWLDIGNPTITSNYSVSPDGNLNSTRVQFASSSNSLYDPIPHSIGDTASIYVKGTSGETIQLGAGVNVGVGQLFTLNGKWQRIEFQSTGATVFCIGTYQSATARDIEVWGAQMENSTYATSYIPTYGSAVTRNGEVCNNSGSVQDFNSEEGVLYAEIAALADDGTFRVISLDDGDNTNVVKFGYRSTSNAIYYEVRSGDVSQAFQIYTTTDVKQFHKVAVLYQQNNFKLFINGVNVLSDTSGVTPVGLNNLSFDVNGYADFYGKTKDLKVFKRAMSDGELYLLTVPQYQSYQEMATALNYTL